MPVDLIPLLGALAALITAIGTLAVSWNNKRKISEVHVLVNSRLTQTLDRVNQLADALQAAGIKLPKDPADPPVSR